MSNTNSRRRATDPEAGARHTLYFVRHGATEMNARGLRCGGDLDVALCDLGRRQVHEAALRLRAMSLGVGLIVTSALERTRESAAIIGATLGRVPIAVEPCFDERHLGRWNRTPHAQTERLLATHATPPGGESESAFMRRVAQGLEQLLPIAHESILIVSSSGVGRALNTLTGGTGRLRLANGELARFELTPHAATIREVLEAYLATLPAANAASSHSLATLD